MTGTRGEPTASEIVVWGLSHGASINPLFETKTVKS